MLFCVAGDVLTEIMMLFCVLGDVVHGRFTLHCVNWQDDGFKDPTNFTEFDEEEEETDDNNDTKKSLYYKFMLRKNNITVPIAEGGVLTIPELGFCADCYFGIRFTSLLW